jgi:hypothetical protein
VRILLTNQRLDVRGGSELYLRDVAAALRRRGHHPIAYSPFLGLAADDLRGCAIPVVRDLALLGAPPDLIHGQHHLPTVEALLRFPGVPAVFFCHGWLPWQEMPPRLSRIVRYVAVDALRRERLITEEGIPPEMVEVIPNFVDLERFRPRPQPLPERAKRALVFSNHAVPGDGFHRLAMTACAERGIEVESLGARTGRFLDRPEDILSGYDIVFARGRAAMEAMAVGCAVILCDDEGLGPMVTRAAVEGLAAANFGLAALDHAPRVDLIQDRLDQYDPADAAAVQGWVREHAGLAAAVDRIEKVYADVIAGWSGPAGVEASAEAAELAAYLHLVHSVVIPQAMRDAQGDSERDAGRRVAAVRAEMAALTEQLEAALEASTVSDSVARAEMAALTEQLEAALEASTASDAVARALTGQVEELNAGLEQLRATRAVHLQSWLRRHSILAGAYRFLLGPYSARRNRDQ